MGEGGVSVRLVVRDVAEITQNEEAALHALWVRTWPLDPSAAPDPAAGQTPVVRVLLLAGDGPDGGALLGGCELLDRTILVAGEPQCVAGLGSVAVAEEHRGRGYGARVVVAAIDAARQRGYEFVVLFSALRNLDFYARFGWRLLAGPRWKTVHGRERVVTSLMMALPLTPEAAERLPAWRHAPIHVGIGQW
jgi:GNAT superfamily N-acetyltransferase